MKNLSWREVAKMLADRMVYMTCGEHPRSEPEEDCPSCDDVVAYKAYTAKLASLEPAPAATAPDRTSVVGRVIEQVLELGSDPVTPFGLETYRHITPDDFDILRGLVSRADVIPDTAERELAVCILNQMLSMSVSDLEGYRVGDSTITYLRRVYGPVAQR